MGFSIPAQFNFSPGCAVLHNGGQPGVARGVDDQFPFESGLGAAEQDLSPTPGIQRFLISDDVFQFRHRIVLDAQVGYHHLAH